MTFSSSSSSSSSILLHFKLPYPHTNNPFRKISSNSCLVPIKISHKCCYQSSKSRTLFKCYSERQSNELQTEENEGEMGIKEKCMTLKDFFLTSIKLLSRENQVFHCFTRLDLLYGLIKERTRYFTVSPGSLSSAIFLVAGTTVGAGILAIPAVTQESGFLASAVVTGLLIAEVNVKTMCELGSGGVNGQENPRKYRSASSLVGVDGSIMIADGKPQPCFRCFLEGFASLEGCSMAGLKAITVVASGDLHWEALLKANFEAAPQSIPIIALSFVYQNVVPVLCTNLEGDLSKVRSAIVFGTAIPLALFLVWDGVILGTITTLGTEADKIADPLQLLRSTNGIVGPIVDIFSLLAIATSYIGFVLGLADFLADLLKLPSGPNRPLPYLLTLVPPLILSLLDPEIFFKALDFAGTYGVLVLFGLLPAAMSWSDRYLESTQTPNLPPLVPGGKIALSLVFGGAALVILSEIVENFAHP
ncbi:hypothetical protein RND71_006238 [Anisodus tanguticus]|uniref:Tyrosine-specific transport protein n=1 Tax=Anisodus tanguticus TaxID=243964 RepID=A0AAE1SVQ7_9SOLA|nr:hypothetical protein RND71_006238 [Anisodus tanguticus]